MAATTVYLISDLHIGGDGGLSRCELEAELRIGAPPAPATKRAGSGDVAEAGTHA